MICTGAGERSALCWECFINLPPPPYLNYFCQRGPGGEKGREGGTAVVELIPLCWRGWCSGGRELRGFVLSQKLVAARVECLGDFNVVKSPKM